MQDEAKITHKIVTNDENATIAIDDATETELFSVTSVYSESLRDTRVFIEKITLDVHEVVDATLLELLVERLKHDQIALATALACAVHDTTQSAQHFVAEIVMNDTGHFVDITIVETDDERSGAIVYEFDARTMGNREARFVAIDEHDEEPTITAFRALSEYIDDHASENVVAELQVFI